MSDSTNAVLQRAYELIEADQLEEAQELLAPLLETDDDNPALWWVYSHALRDQSIGQLALDRVLELDPSYPGANELKEDVQAVLARDPDFLDIAGDENLGAQEATGSAVDDWEDLRAEIEAGETSSGRRQGAVVLAIILFVVAAGIALVASDAFDISELWSGIPPSPEAEIIVVSAPIDQPPDSETVASEATPEITMAATALPTEKATVEATLESTAEATAIQETPPVSQVSTAEATVVTVATVAATADAEAEASPAPDDASNPLSAFVGAVAASISDFEIDRRASAVENTPLGRTIVVQVCAVPGREFNARLNQVIDAMVNLAEQIPEDTEAVAAGLLNCADDGASLRVIGVSVDVVQQYLDEAIDTKEFQRAWQPLS